jgi:hypothetical protein
MRMFICKIKLSCSNVMIVLPVRHFNEEFTIL